MIIANEIRYKFDAWFSNEYGRLRERLALSYCLDEDAFHDAYLCIRDKFRKPLEHLPNFCEVFLKEYKRISKVHINEEFQMIYPELQFFDAVASDQPEAFTQQEESTDKSQLIRKIDKFVKKHYKPVWVVMWYNKHVGGLSYKDLSLATGFATDQVKQSIETITDNVARHFSITA